MTPAITLVKKHKINHQVHEYTHDVTAESYGLEAVEKLGIPAERVFKTLVVQVDARELVVGIVPVAGMLSLKAMAKAAGGKKAVMADKALVERTTGYVVGGVSPLGQKKRLKTVIDTTARDFDTINVSAGRRGLEIELSPGDLLQVLNAQYADIAQS